MILDSCRVPVVLAPLAGGPSTPELTAAVSEAGGLGFLGAGYLTAMDAADRIRRTRQLTSRPFGVNVFVPGAPAAAAAVNQYAEALAALAGESGVSLGSPVFEDDDWDAKISALLAEPVPVVSFTFGFPAADIVARLKQAGSEVWMTAGTVAEARTDGPEVTVGTRGLPFDGHVAGTLTWEPLSVMAEGQLRAQQHSERQGRLSLAIASNAAGRQVAWAASGRRIR